MFNVVRISVPQTVHDSERRVTTHIEPNYVWDYVAENHKSWHTKGVRLLYMTHRHMQEDTSLIIDSDDPDSLADFLTTHIAPLEHVRGIWVLNMAKMRFFKIPLEHPGDFHRYTVTIDAAPRCMAAVFDNISNLRPGRDIIINYIANTFQSFSASIMVSVLARSRSHMDAFVKDCILPLAGVVHAEVTHISKTMRLVSSEEWQKSVGPYLVVPGGEHIKDIDANDDTLIAGC